jgi:Zn finger protein HypA/HybF involved in hydrogenase expression
MVTKRYQVAQPHHLHIEVFLQIDAYGPSSPAEHFHVQFASSVTYRTTHYAAWNKELRGTDEPKEEEVAGLQMEFLKEEFQYLCPSCHIKMIKSRRMNIQIFKSLY